MHNFKRVVTSIALVSLMAGGISTSSAQNMSGTVVERRVKFARGKTSATLRGRANYAMSYVYQVGAEKGQQMNVRLTSNRGLVTFSLIAPDSQTLDDAFGVRDWSGELPRTGDYSIVVVMNEKQAANVPYALEVTIR